MSEENPNIPVLSAVHTVPALLALRYSVLEYRYKVQVQYSYCTRTAVDNSVLFVDYIMWTTARTEHKGWMPCVRVPCVPYLHVISRPAVLVLVLYHYCTRTVQVQ